MSIATFYAQSRWGTRFGVVDDEHPNGHRGLDIESHAGEGIPALRPGKVVRSQYSSILGWVIVIEVGPGDYDGYCHTINGVGKSADVAAGQIIAAVADFGELHGSAWTGPHTHITLGPNADSVFSGTVFDPLPLLIAILTSTAGNGSTTPLPNQPKQEDEMRFPFITAFKDAAAYTVTFPTFERQIAGNDPMLPRLVSFLNAEVNNDKTWYPDGYKPGSAAVFNSKAESDWFRAFFTPPATTGGGGSGSEFDDTAILAAIAAGNKSILSAIANVDENTLATFGLKRA